MTIDECLKRLPKGWYWWAGTICKEQRAQSMRFRREWLRDHGEAPPEYDDAWAWVQLYPPGQFSGKAKTMWISSRGQSIEDAFTDAIKKLKVATRK